MGIPRLNRFLLDNCTKQSISKKNLSCFSGKTIVVDTSIYLYKFTSENALIENMYLLISIFNYNNITPIFVFDGKPPIEKKETLENRRIEKNKAERKYKELKKELEIIEKSSNNNNNMNTNKIIEDKKELYIELDTLKKKFIRIKDEDIQQVKELMNSYNITYYVAEGEADKLCAQLVINKYAWACLSDDMDLFVYGCTRVIRHISLLNQTVIFYNIQTILRELDIPMRDFKEIMILSGTDYNMNDCTSLTKTIKYYKDFKLSLQSQSSSLNEPATDLTIHSNNNFYNWLILNTKYIQNYENLIYIYKMFDIYDFDISSLNENRKEKNFEKMKCLLGNYGFIFL